MGFSNMSFRFFGLVSALTLVLLSPLQSRAEEPAERTAAYLAQLDSEYGGHEVFSFQNGASLHFFFHPKSLRGTYLYVSADQTHVRGVDSLVSFGANFNDSTPILRGLNNTLYTSGRYTWALINQRLYFFYDNGHIQDLEIPADYPLATISSMILGYKRFTDPFDTERKFSFLQLKYEDTKSGTSFEQILYALSEGPVFVALSPFHEVERDSDSFSFTVQPTTHDDGRIAQVRLLLEAAVGPSSVDSSVLKEASRAAGSKKTLRPLLIAPSPDHALSRAPESRRHTPTEAAEAKPRKDSEEAIKTRFNRHFEVRTAMTELPESISEIEQQTLRQIARRLHTGSVVLTGESGVGKSFWVQWFIKRAREGGVSQVPSETRFIEVDRVTLNAGASLVGMSEAIVAQMIKTAQEAPTVFVIEGLSSLAGMGAHSQSSTDFFSLIQHEISRGTIRILATDDAAKFSDAFAGLGALERALPRLDIQSLNREQTIDVLLAYAKSQNFPMMTRTDAIRIIDYSTRFSPSTHEPGASMLLARAFVEAGHEALQALSEQAPSTRSESAEPQPLVLDLEDTGLVNLEAIAREIYHVPEAYLSADRARDQLRHLRETLDQNIIGQEAAKKMVLNQVLLSLAEVNRTERPSMRLLFFGQPGVGKTALAKSIAEGLGVRIFEYAMNQYSNPNQESIKKLIESLYRDLATDPFGVFLLDEIEKAHPAIQDILLQLFNDGYGIFDIVRSTGGNQVRRVRLTARNARFVLTTNAGQQELRREANPLGFGSGASTSNSGEVDLSAVSFASALKRDGISEYLLDRVTAIPFLPLTRAQFETALRMRIEYLLANTLTVEHGFAYNVQLQNIAAYARWLTNHYFSAAVSGRDIDKILERTLLTRLAELRLHPSAPSRGTTLTLEFNEVEESLDTDFCEGAFL